MAEKEGADVLAAFDIELMIFTPNLQILYSIVKVRTRFFQKLLIRSNQRFGKERHLETMDYRHEWKHIINDLDRLAIRMRMRAIAQPDSYAINGIYTIRSLYFDTPTDRALREKLDGVNVREKFRIRYYNEDMSGIHLEKKSKRNGLGTKENADLSREEAQSIVDGNLSWMMESGRPLVQELYYKMHTQGLRPKTIVDYTREPYVYAPGNVRVTLDYNIRTGLGSTDFLNPKSLTIPVGGTMTILEVKWDEYLPAVIQQAIQLEDRRVTSFSKYAACRMYD